MSETSRFASLSDAVSFLGCSRRTLQRHIKKGTIGTYRLPGGRKNLIDWAELRQFAALSVPDPAPLKMRDPATALARALNMRRRG